MRIVCVSDTHLMHERGPLEVPDGDLLIHAGDALAGGSLSELVVFCGWLAKLPHRRKVFVPGNHDWPFEQDLAAAKARLPEGVICLVDEEAVVDGLRIYGSPWQPEFMDWAFNLPRGHRLREKWNRVPNGVDILVTHGPPLRILDLNYASEHVGCGDLHDVVTGRVRPRLHVFGHIHGGHGTFAVGPTLFVNASICDEAYRPDFGPVVLDLEPDGIRVVDAGLRRKDSPRPLTRSTRPLW